MIVVMSGLPGSGKSTIADAVGRALGFPVLSVDPIESAMRRVGIDHAQPTGLAAYVVADVLADRIVRLGQSVIVDAVNHVEPARGQWRAIAARHEVPMRVIEVVCSDEALHRRRLAARVRDLAGFPEPTWDDVEAARAESQPWTDPRLTVDSAGDLAANVTRVLDHLGAA